MLRQSSRRAGKKRPLSKLGQPHFRSASRGRRRLVVESLEQRWLLNAGPVANDDAYSIGQDSILVESPPGLLANDSDADDDPLEVTEVDQSGTSGLVAWNKNGSFAYDPQGQFNYLASGETATDMFSYTISDGQGGTNTAIVTMTIVGNGAPVAADDGYGTNEDTPLEVSPPGVLTNDTDPDAGDVLTVSGVDMSGTLGEVTWNANGSFTYDPNGQFEGLAVGETASDAFVYTLSDAFGGTDTATVTITVNGVNDAPVAEGRCLRHGREHAAGGVGPRGVGQRHRSGQQRRADGEQRGHQRDAGQCHVERGWQLHLRSERAVRGPGGRGDGHGQFHLHGQRRQWRFGHGQRDRSPSTVSMTPRWPRTMPTPQTRTRR